MKVYLNVQSLHHGVMFYGCCHEERVKEVEFPVDFPILIDTISIGLPILNFKKLQLEVSKL